MKSSTENINRLYERIWLEKNPVVRDVLIEVYTNRLKWDNIDRLVKTAKKIGTKHAMIVSSKLTGYGFTANLDYVNSLN
jgi:hypothetical protein